MTPIHATTVLGVLHNGRVALGSDGQATMGDTVMKHKAQKVRPLYGGKLLCGFAGSTADAFTLFERFEAKLEQFTDGEVQARAEDFYSRGLKHGGPWVGCDAMTPMVGLRW